MDEELRVRDIRRGFYWIRNHFIGEISRELGVYGIAVYNVLTRMAGQEQKCYPTLKTISELINCSEDKVSESVKALVEHGIIKVEYGFRNKLLFTLLEFKKAVKNPLTTGTKTPCQNPTGTGTLLNNNHTYVVTSNYIANPQSKPFQLLTKFAQRFEQHYHIKYPIMNRGKDLSLLKTVIDTYDSDTCAELIDIAYEQIEEDKWLKDRMTVGTWYSRVPQLIIKVQKVREGLDKNKEKEKRKKDRDVKDEKELKALHDRADRLAEL